MSKELELIEKVSRYLAEQSAYNEFKYHYGPSEQMKNKLLSLRFELTTYMRERRLAIAGEEKRERTKPVQKKMF